jgi:peptidyl-prolyl cis-trans isomerase SurA
LGIPRIFFERQIRAQILWAKFVASRLRPQVFVSEEDVEEELAGLEINRGKPEYLVSQIDLYFGEPSKAEEVTATAHQLVRQVRAGAQFATIAAQFSHNAIGGSGGDMGWMRESQLRPELALVVAGMEVGDVSDPVRTIDGVHIIHLRQRREIMASDPSRVRVRLIQVTLPNLTGGADDAVARQSVFVEEIRDNIRGCEDMASLVEELKSDASGDLGWVSLGDLPDVFRGPLLNLEIGVPSAPVRTEFACIY